MTYEGTIAEVRQVFEGSNGDRTRALYSSLEARGSAGAVALNVFRALKTSTRAKLYRGRNQKGRFRDQAYATKDWSIGNLADELVKSAEALNIVWGWGIDPFEQRHGHLIYIELPTGQVSFHNGHRRAGPDFPREWDEAHGTAPGRIIRWCAQLLATMEPFDITDGANRYAACPECGMDRGLGLITRLERVAVECMSCHKRGPEILQVVEPLMLADRNAFEGWNELSREKPVIGTTQPALSLD